MIRLRDLDDRQAATLTRLIEDEDSANVEAYLLGTIEGELLDPRRRVRRRDRA